MTSFGNMNIYNKPLIYLGASPGRKVFTPPTEEESTRAMAKRKVFNPPTEEECQKALNKKKNIKAAQYKLKRFSAKPQINSYYIEEKGYPECGNRTILFENVSSENRSLLFDEHSLDQAIIEFRKDIIEGNRTLVQGYVYNGKTYLAAIPSRKWRKEDYKKDMYDYYKSGEWKKDVIKTADWIDEKVNLPQRAMTSLINVAMERINKLDRVKRNGACFLLGTALAVIAKGIGKVCPKVIAKVAGRAGGPFVALSFASLTCHIIFDFSGFTEFIKNSGEQAFFMLLGSIAALGTNPMNIIKRFRGKKVTISPDGSLKATPIKDLPAEMAKLEKDAGAESAGAQAPGKTQGAHSAAKQAEQPKPQGRDAETRLVLARQKFLPKYEEFNKIPPEQIRQRIKFAAKANFSGYYLLEQECYYEIAKYIMENKLSAYDMTLINISKRMNNLMRPVFNKLLQKNGLEIKDGKVVRPYAPPPEKPAPTKEAKYVMIPSEKTNALGALCAKYKDAITVKEKIEIAGKIDSMDFHALANDFYLEIIDEILSKSPRGGYMILGKIHRELTKKSAVSTLFQFELKLKQYNLKIDGDRAVRIK